MMHMFPRSVQARVYQSSPPPYCLNPYPTHRTTQPVYATKTLSSGSQIPNLAALDMDMDIDVDADVDTDRDVYIYIYR